MDNQKINDYDGMKAMVDNNKNEDYIVQIPTVEEAQEYNERRAEAADIALQTARDDAYNRRVDSLLSSVSTEKNEPKNNANEQVAPQINDYEAILKSTEDRQYRENQTALNQSLEKERQQIQSEIDNRHNNFMEKVNQSFEVYMKQQAKIHEREETPEDVEIKSTAKELVKKVIATVGVVAVMAGATHIAGNIQKSDAELKEEQDALNAMHQKQVEAEQQIEELREKTKENEKDYMTYYDENGNIIVYNQNSQEARKKVKKIETLEHNYEESVNKGGRQ